MFKKYFLPLFIGIALTVGSSYAGVHLQIFELVPHIDKLFHFTGGAIAAWLVIIYFSRELKTISRTKRFVIILGGVCLIGLGWEWLEYAVGEYSSMFAHSLYPYFHIGSLTDTLGDFAADLLGGALIAALTSVRR
jgi:hypothetical protein